jgi:hypothetical protein
MYCPVCQSNVSDASAVCPSCGFNLQGNTQQFSPVSVNGEAAQAADATSYCLTVIRGPQVGISYNLTSKETTIGRNPTCTIFLNDMTVSRNHATIKNNAGQFLITDNKSFNGVWVNNTSISAKTLNVGDIIQIGTFAFVFDRA